MFEAFTAAQLGLAAGIIFGAYVVRGLSGFGAGLVSTPLLALLFPITMVVPFPPGGLADIVARPVAEAMARDLGQPVVVENKPGAGGGIGMAQVAKSKADGYSLLMALSSVVVLPEADKVLQRSPMFQLDQLKPIARFTADPTVLVVRADSPWKPYAEFLAYVKANPAKISFGSSGNYGTMHVPMEMLKASAGFRMVHIPYTGSNELVTSIVSGTVQLTFIVPGAVRQHIELQEQGDAYYFIADYHALTTLQDAAKLRENVHDVALDYLALGLDPARACLFFQSDVPEVCELTWLLMTVTPLGLLEKCHAFKDKKAKGLNADAGLFTYPVLMAADILAYDAQVVPVGESSRAILRARRRSRISSLLLKSFAFRASARSAMRRSISSAEIASSATRRDLIRSRYPPGSDVKIPRTCATSATSTD